MAQDHGVTAEAAALPPSGLSRDASQAKPAAANARSQPWYLTNTPLTDEGLCLAAARESGFDVRFEREPMPYDGSADDHDYHREALIGALGCVVSYDARSDHSPFWQVWRRLSAADATNQPGDVV